MSLVAYDYSDSEEEKEQTGEDVKSKEFQKIDKPKLPVKISVPALEYDSDEEPFYEKSKSKDNGKKSGLLHLLPPPKEQPEKILTLIPNVIKKKSSVVSNLPVTNNTKVENSKTLKKVQNESNNEDDSDSDEDDEIVTNFDEELWKTIISPPKRKSFVPTVTESAESSESFNSSTATVQEIKIAPEPVKPYEGLDNAAFKELVGSKKRKRENIDIIDIHEDEIRPDKEEWLKSLTDPAYAPKPTIEDPVNDTCKRKHHITYLAQQAKANELELQNQWAQNQFARKQTQAKYGF